MVFHNFLLLLALLSSTLATSPPIILESRNAAPPGFTLHGPAPPDTMLTLRIALAQGNMKGLEDELYAVSDPAGERYGAHLSKSEVRIIIRYTLSDML